MKVRSELLVTCAALVLCAVTPVRAADLVTKAPIVAPTAWWYEGYAEVGYRFDDPDRSKLGRFYKYEDLRPGVFGNFYYGAHRTGPDPWDLAFWGTNAGWDDQAFGLDMSKPGTYYLTFGWDETPHVYSKDAKTTYTNVGGNVLGTVPYPTTSIAAAQAVVNANTNVFDLKIRRDTGSFQGRWTPDSNWDITAGYTNMHREGTQQLSAVSFGGFTGGTTPVSIQLPKPVNDTTHNADLKAEYNGSSPWGKPFNVALGYAFSQYNDTVGCGAVAGTVQPTSSNCLTFQNPWVTGNSAAGPLWNRYSLPPDNSAHTVNLTGGAGLPLNSRYMGTLQYSWMLQNDAFEQATINSALVNPALPASSLNGDARTTLSNNVINTQITPDLDSTMRYRYYDYHSETSPLAFTGLWDRPDSNTGGNQVGVAYPINFTKQNASEQLVYRPWKWLDVGGAYEWERWKHQYSGAVDVVTNAGSTTIANFSTATNENAAKVFFDAKWGWSTLRTSVRYSERRYDGDYIDPAARNLNNSTHIGVTMRTVDLQNRDSTEVKSSWAINVTDAITVTPTGGYRLDNYQADAVNTAGVLSSGIRDYEAWNVGADISWTVSPTLALYVSYLHDDGIRDTLEGTATSSKIFYHSHDLDDVFIVGGKYIAIPDKLFLNATYTYSQGTSKWATSAGPFGASNYNGLYPPTHNTNHRIDGEAKYMLDPTWLRTAALLPTAQPYVKFRAIYEHNSNDSWQNMEQQLGWAVNPNDTTMQRAIFLGMSNPNYDVFVGMASVGLKW